MKIRTVADESFHVVGRADGRTDSQSDKHTDIQYKANNPFSLFCERE
jgi:hypothetical protein